MIPDGILTCMDATILMVIILSYGKEMVLLLYLSTITEMRKNMALISAHPFIRESLRLMMSFILVKLVLKISNKII